MRRIKLTQVAVRDYPSPETRIDLWDTELKGFGVRVSPQGRKTFFVMQRVNGRLVRATVGKFPALGVDEARKKARKMIVDMEEGKNPNDELKQRRSGELTLAGVFRTFMGTRKDKRQALTPRTEGHYKMLFEKHLDHWKGRHVAEFSPAMVQDLHQHIGETRGTNVANQVLRLFRRLMNFSRGRHAIPAINPVSGVEWYKDGRRSVVIKPSDMPKWFKAVDGMHNETMRDYLLLVLFSGLRRNEAFTLTWENVDLEDRTLTIPPEMAKNAELHIIPLSDFLYRLLKDRQERWQTTSGYVFPSHSKTGHLTNVQHGMKQLQASGLQYTLHDLRRTFITTAESLDISVYTVKRLANHKQQDVTGKHYIVHDIDRLRGPMEKISLELLRQASGAKGKLLPIRKAV